MRPQQREDGEFDVAELVNFVTVAHVKALVANYHEHTASTTTNTSPTTEV